MEKASKSDKKWMPEHFLFCFVLFLDFSLELIAE